MNKLGIDIVEIDRLQKCLSSTFVEKVLSNEELDIYRQYNGNRKSEYLAGRWAAKEAIIKCLSDYETPLMNDITILNNDKGKPIVKYKDYDIELSISHEIHYAIAIACLNNKGD